MKTLYVTSKSAVNSNGSLVSVDWRILIFHLCIAEFWRETESAISRRRRLRERHHCVPCKLHDVIHPVSTITCQFSSIETNNQLCTFLYMFEYSANTCSVSPCVWQWPESSAPAGAPPSRLRRSHKPRVFVRLEFWHWSCLQNTFDVSDVIIGDDVWSIFWNCSWVGWYFSGIYLTIGFGLWTMALLVDYRSWSNCEADSVILVFALLPAPWSKRQKKRCWKIWRYLSS